MTLALVRGYKAFNEIVKPQMKQGYNQFINQSIGTWSQSLNP